MFSNCDMAEFTNPTKLESRLVEYMKKKKFYKKNGIQDELLEKEYNISKNDLQKIKMYGSQYSDLVNTQTKKFESITDIPDKRLDLIKQKQQRDKDANDQRQNYDIMARGYDMYAEGKKFSSANSKNFESHVDYNARSNISANHRNVDFKTQFNPQAWNMGNDQTSKDQINPNASQIVDMRRRYANTNIYKHEPVQIRYNDYMTRGNNEDLNSKSYSLDSIIGNLESYKQNTRETYGGSTRPDVITKTMVPHNACNNKRDNINNYKMVPYMNGSNMRDVEVENYLSCGSEITRSQKSRGYPSAFENQYQYISPDIQNPDHVVFERGMPSRLANKTVASEYKTRDIMM